MTVVKPRYKNANHVVNAPFPEAEIGNSVKILRKISLILGMSEAKLENDSGGTYSGGIEPMLEVNGPRERIVIFGNGINSE